MQDINVNIVTDMTEPQQAVDSLRETCRLLTKELVQSSPEAAERCANAVSEMSSQLRPGVRLLIDEIVSLLRQETAN